MKILVDPSEYAIVPINVESASRAMRLIYASMPGIANLELSDMNAARRYLYDECKRWIAWLEQEGVKP